jgi:magnesium-transporting ATPase (P-type)
LQWLFNSLHTHPKNGISNDPTALADRRKLLGSNNKYQPPLSSFCEHFTDALDDFILKILIAASLFSIAVEVGTAESNSERSTAWIEGFVILVAVAVCGLVTAANDYSKERQFAQLNSVADERKRVTIVRDGKLLEIHQDDVLVGDVVQVSEGMEVPADAILIEANEITTDESAMTG